MSSLINEALKKQRNEAMTPTLQLESVQVMARLSANTKKDVVPQLVSGLARLTIGGCLIGAIAAFVFNLMTAPFTPAPRVIETPITLQPPAKNAELNADKTHSPSKLLAKETVRQPEIPVELLSIEATSDATSTQNLAKSQALIAEVAQSEPVAVTPVETLLVPQKSASQPVSAGFESQEPKEDTRPKLDLSAKSNPAVINFLEAANISGIRIAGSNSRLLMNNQVYKVGSIVETTTNLRITDILENEIQFVDESGAFYRKQIRR